MVSVVIATLGGDLSKTIYSINNGSLKPDEIIISLPDSSRSILNSSLHSNLKLIYANQYGQVIQRLKGFKEAKGDYVLQVDDDVILDRYCLENLVNFLKKNSCKLAASPCLYDLDGNSLYIQQGEKAFAKIYYRLINGKKKFLPGGITLAGTNLGVTPNNILGDYIKVQWQPGGCILHKRNNLYMHNYYPFSGKAYSEDLIHSFLLRRDGIKLFVLKNAKCSTKACMNLLSFKELTSDFKSRRYFVRLADLSLSRMYIHYFFYLIKKFFKR